MGAHGSLRVKLGTWNLGDAECHIVTSGSDVGCHLAGLMFHGGGLAFHGSAGMDRARCRRFNDTCQILDMPLTIERDARFVPGGALGCEYEYK